MKKIILALVALMVMVSTAFAEDIGRVHVGGRIGYMMPSEGFEPSVYPSINVGFGSDADCSVELSVGYASLRAKSTSDGEDTSIADVTTIPVLLTVLPRLRLSNLSLYLGGGIGYYINKGELSSEAKDLVKAMRVIDPTFDISVKVGNAFGAQLATGADYFVSKKIAIGVDVRYLWAWSFGTVDMKAAGGSESVKDKIDMDSLMVGAGVKYLF